MLIAMLVLLACQLTGEIVARATGVPVPGPVIGLVLLFLGLVARDRWRGPDDTAPADGVDAPLSAVCGFLLANLSLLFVPAGVGIVRHAGTIAGHGWAIGVALVASAAVTLVVTAIVFEAVARRVSTDRGAPS